MRFDLAFLRSSLIDHPLRTAEPLSARTQALNLQLTLLIERLSTLLSTPPAASQAPSSTEADPWSSRAAFINWAATGKVDALPAAGTTAGTREGEDGILGQMQEAMRTTGGQGEAAVSSWSGPVLSRRALTSLNKFCVRACWRNCSETRGREGSGRESLGARGFVVISYCHELWSTRDLEGRIGT